MKMKKTIIYRSHDQPRTATPLLTRTIDATLWTPKPYPDNPISNSHGRRVCYAYDKSPLSPWYRWTFCHPSPSFKMDYATEVIAQSFIKTMFKPCLPSTRRNNILEIMLNDYVIVIENIGGSLRMNGQTVTRTTAGRYLSALCFQTKDSDSREQVRDTYFKICSVPSDVNYVILNRTPYSFYKDREFIQCRLNTRQISSKEIALEISDGLWGSLSIKDFMGYLSHYLHGTQRGSWVHTSPENLYHRLMRKEGRESDIQVMKNFLAQNRTSDLISKRAEVLLKETLEKYPDKVKHFETEGREFLFVKGIENDWVISWNSNRSAKAGRQLVTTQYLSVSSTTHGHLFKEDSSLYSPMTKQMMKEFYKSSIDISDGAHEVRISGESNVIGIPNVCVDNLQNNSPQIDQAISRVLVGLNDKATKQMVSTMKNIQPAKLRIDFSSLKLKKSKVLFSLEVFPECRIPDEED